MKLVNVCKILSFIALSTFTFVMPMDPPPGSMPYNFYWANEEHTLAGMGCPLGVEEIKALAAQGITAIVSLTPDRLGDPELYTAVKDSIFADKDILHLPIEDYQAPTLEDFYKFVDFIKQHPDGKIAIHCTAGQGRTGTILVAYKIYTALQKGVKPVEIDIDKYIQELRNFSKVYVVETGAQKNFLQACKSIFSVPKAFTNPLFGILAIPQEYSSYTLYPSMFTVLKTALTSADKNVVPGILVKMLGSAVTCDSLFPENPQAIRALIETAIAAGWKTKVPPLVTKALTEGKGERQKLIIRLLLLNLGYNDPAFLDDTVKVIDTYFDGQILYSGLAKACALTLKDLDQARYDQLATKLSADDLASDPLFVELPSKKCKECLMIITKASPSSNLLAENMFSRLVKKGDTSEKEAFSLQDILELVDKEGLIQTLATPLEMVIKLILSSDQTCMAMIPANMECVDLVTRLATRLMSRRNLLAPESLDELRVNGGGQNRQKLLLSYILIINQYSYPAFLTFAVETLLNCIERTYTGPQDYYGISVRIAEAIIKNISNGLYTQLELDTIKKACNNKRIVVYSPAKGLEGKSEEYKQKILAALESGPSIAPSTSKGDDTNITIDGKNIVVPNPVPTIVTENPVGDAKKIMSSKAFNSLEQQLRELAQKSKIEGVSAILNSSIQYMSWANLLSHETYALSDANLIKLLNPLKTILMTLMAQDEALRSMFAVNVQASKCTENLTIFTEFAAYLIKKGLLSTAELTELVKSGSHNTKLLAAYILLNIGEAVDPSLLTGALSSATTNEFILKAYKSNAS